MLTGLSTPNVLAVKSEQRGTSIFPAVANFTARAQAQGPDCTGSFKESNNRVVPQHNDVTASHSRE